MSGIPEITAYPLPTAQQLPANLARWSLEPRRAVLLVHDMQRYFLRPLPESLRAGLVANAARLRRWCVEQGVQIAYTAQPGSMTEEQRGLLKDFWGPGMRASPADREVVEELAPGPDDWLLTKWRYSAFFHSDLLQRMRAAGRDQSRHPIRVFSVLPNVYVDQQGGCVHIAKLDEGHIPVVYGKECDGCRHLGLQVDDQSSSHVIRLWMKAESIMCTVC
ncbi:phenazine biosynthesis protein PhzD [Pseudomonas aeruginosa PA38182]|nr:phenazine biosynthesis protein PhzD [Pseudomonas aeruginosa PA38182]